MNLYSPSPLHASSIITNPILAYIMDNFQRIELIVKGRLNERKQELEKCRRRESTAPSGLYVLGVKHEVCMLMRIAGDIDSIKRDHPPTRNEI